MKKIYFLLLFVGLLAYTQAQVGVNTTTLRLGTLLHIDPNGDTAALADSINNVVISNTGKVGIGTLTPEAKLDIKNTTTGKGLRIVDGNQGEGKILKSDVDGNASWQDRPILDAGVTNYYYLANGAQDYIQGATPKLVLSAPITDEGAFLVYLRWWGTAGVTANDNIVSANLYLTASSVEGEYWDGDQNNKLDQARYYLKVPTFMNRFSFTEAFYGNVTDKNTQKYLKIYLQVLSSHIWKLNAVSPGNRIFSPSMIVSRI